MNLLKEPITEITHLIPQKAPFVMVSSLVSFTETSITSSFCIKDDTIFLEDGFFLEPGIIEHMAQTVALHTGYSYFLKGEDAPTGYIGSIKKVNINYLPKLNEVITSKVSVIHEFMGVTLVEITTYNSENKIIGTSQMKTVIA